ncbi:hypothetical protein G7046_g377 [Stylonectria norvegica]|nr:hypothetical protein G7046_g377 [Stylonectria norvegica]
MATTSVTVSSASKYDSVTKPANELLGKYEAEAKTIRDLLQSLKQTGDEVDTLQKAKTDLEGKLNAALNRIAQAEKEFGQQLNAAKDSIAKLTKEVESEKQQLANANNTIAQLRRDVDSANKAYNAEKQRLSKAYIDLEEANETLAKVLPFVHEGESNDVIRIHGICWGPKQITDHTVYQRLLDHAKARRSFQVSNSLLIHDTWVGQGKNLTIAYSLPNQGPLKFLVAIYHTLIQSSVDSKIVCSSSAASMSDGKYVDDSYYFYAPNKGAAIFFAIAFCASGCVHAWQNSHYKCWILMPFFPFCSLLFTAGFALRGYGAFHYNNLDVYIASICITYAAPPLLELQNYHILGRILYYVPYLSPLHPGRVLTTFGFVSGIIEALNGLGASYSANSSLPRKQIEAGHALIKASLILQIVVAACFVYLAVVFHRRCLAHGIMNARLRSSLITLYTSTALILARTIYRLVEYFSVAELHVKPGFDPMSMSAIIRYEWFFYVFEAVVMLCNSVLFNVRHPRRYLPRSNKIYLAQDGVTEVEGPGLKDPRPKWQTFLDPFDIHGAVTGKMGHQTDKFWENGDAVGSETSPKA